MALKNDFFIDVSAPTHPGDQIQLVIFPPEVGEGAIVDSLGVQVLTATQARSYAAELIEAADMIDTLTPEQSKLVWAVGQSDYLAGIGADMEELVENFPSVLAGADLSIMEDRYNDAQDHARRSTS